MSMIRRCDICEKEIAVGEDYERVMPGNGNDETLDICLSCWVLLMHNIKAAQQQRREETKESDKMFSDPWDPGVMAFKNGERMC